MADSDIKLFTAPRVIVSGTHAGVGKSIVTLGLTFALRKLGLSVSCGLIGANLPQAVLLKRLTNRFVRTLDERLLSRDQTVASLYYAGLGTDLILIEGRAGLYDGYIPATLRGSDAEIAALTKTPVILVIDARGFGNSVAALVKGYAETAKGFQLGCVIANRLPSEPAECEAMVQEFQDSVAAEDLPQLYGGLPEFDAGEYTRLPEVTERVNAASVARQFLVDLSKLVERYVNLEELVGIAKHAAKIQLENFDTSPMSRRTRIAYSDDPAFNLGFQDNLDLLRFYGADLVPFSPLADRALPKNIGAVYMTGGCLRDYAAELTRNESMRQSLRDFVDAGGALYSEGASTAYLCDSYRLSGEERQEFEGVGLLPGRAEPGEHDVQYSESVTVEESILGRPGLIVKSISTGEW